MCIFALQSYLLLLTFKSRSTVPHLYEAVVQISKGFLLEWLSFMRLVQLSDLVAVEEALWMPSFHHTDLSACREVCTTLCSTMPLGL